MKKQSEKEHTKASELLGDWRAAERDVVSAKKAVEVAQLAVAAAEAAEEAARQKAQREAPWSPH